MFELEGYEVVRKLGAGGVGEVYLAKQLVLDRLVAVKRVMRAYDGDPETAARFRREAQVLGRLSHPAIVDLFDLTPSGADLLMVMEYVPGWTLESLLFEGRVGKGGGVQVLVTVADALAYAASQHVVHRDVKPGNVFVDEAGRAKLGDFGLARVLSDTTMFRSALGTIAGTPAYMAPEQVRGQELTPAADVYALAVMAYEVLVGRLPFLQEGEITGLLMQHIDAQPPHPATIVPGFPPAVADVILYGMVKDPNGRPSVAQWSQMLQAAMPPEWQADGLRLPNGAVALPYSSSAPSSAPVPAAAPAPLPSQLPQPSPVVTGATGRDPGWVQGPVYVPPAAPAAPPKGKSKTGPILAGAIALVVIVAVVAVLAAGGGSKPKGSGGSSGSQLTVSDAAVTVSPADGEGHCPEAQFHFTAKMTTNGVAGTLRYRWHQPNGRTVDGQIEVSSGVERAEATLDFSFSGENPANGPVTFETIDPIGTPTDPIELTYLCP